MRLVIQLQAGVFVALWILLLPGAVAAQIQLPELTGRVVDEANLLSTSTEADLVEMLQAHETETGQQVMVVTVQSLNGRTIEEFGVELGRTWGIGQAEQDNGVLLIVAPNERQVRIEVGYGLEGALTDAKASVIIQNEIIPAFRTGDRARGIVDGTRAILAALRGEAETLSGIAEDDQKFAIPPVLIFFIFILIGMSLRSFGRHGRGHSRSGSRMGGWSSGGGFSCSRGSRFSGGGSSGSW